MKITFQKFAFMAITSFTLQSCLLLDGRYRRNINEDISHSKIANANLETNEEFLIVASEISLREILFGHLAHENALSPDVKRLGKKIADAHQKLLDGLNKIATEKFILLPTINDEKVIITYEKLRAKSGTDFDNYFCNLMIKFQKEGIALFEESVVSTNDSTIRNFALNSLPELHEQLENAISCQSNCKKNKRCYPLE